MKRLFRQILRRWRPPSSTRASAPEELSGLSHSAWLDLLRSSGGAFVLKVTGAGLSFGFYVLLGRLLGADGSGLYFLALTVTSVAAVVSRLGMENALLRFVAEGASQGDWGQVAGVSRKGVALAGSAALAIALVVYMIAPVLSVHLFDDSELVLPLRVMAASIPPVSLLKLYSALLKGIERIGTGIFVETVSVPGVCAALLPLLAPKFGAGGAAAAYAGAALLTMTVAVLLWWRATPNLRSVKEHFDTGRLLSTSAPLFWVAALSLIIAWTDTTVLGIWAASSEVGVYGVALRTATLTSFILASVTSVVAPKFAALSAEGRCEDLTALVQRSTKLVTVISTPMLLLFVLFPRWVLGLFGPEFRVGAVLLIILAVGQFVNAASGSVGYLLMMTGKEKLLRNNVLLAAGLNLAGNLLLVPTFGALGAAIATAGSLAIVNVAAVQLVKNHLSILVWPGIQRQ